MTIDVLDFTSMGMFHPVKAHLHVSLISHYACRFTKKYKKIIISEMS